VVAEVGDRLALSKQTTIIFHMKFNLKKLKEIKGKEQYGVEISNRFATLENLNNDADINKAWKQPERIPKFQSKRV
jgi:hypothetical protein